MDYESWQRWKKKMDRKVEIAHQRHQALDPKAPDYQEQSERLHRRVRFLRHHQVLAAFRVPSYDGKPPQLQVHYTLREEA
ncbi:hypothetical protein [Myxococcus vastator]|uniref:hypothetical protein n=1 Tax=Myxococcus vastator TaxID=2709664 RepID=UPI0013D00A40|nr:hypothetical protein [Myxococcus vastator]